MRILIQSTLFWPSVGGTETVMRLLAEEFSRVGHEVKVITSSPSTLDSPFEFQVMRQPTLREHLEALAWCEVVLQSCISIKQLVPCVLVRKPVVAIHHTWYRDAGFVRALACLLKRQLCRFVHNISVSSGIANHIPASSLVINNPYDSDIFSEVDISERTAELLFVGRLVSDKGVSLLIESLALLRNKSALNPKLTIVGAGPELAQILQLIESYGLTEQVSLLGELSPELVARQMQTHQLLIIPSLWDEPFGVVALEAIACNCIPVGTLGDGLSEAIGNCGLLVNRTAAELSNCIIRLLQDQELRRKLLTESKTHLLSKRKDIVAQSYLSFLNSVIK